MLAKDEQVELHISQQGAPWVNDGVVRQAGDAVVAVAIDLRSKWCTVCSTGDDDGIPLVQVELTERSTNFNADVDREATTEILFPQFDGWSIWSAQLTRYTLYVCLVKNEEEDHGNV